MTIKDHIMTLPDGYRELALKYEDDVWKNHSSGLVVALYSAFVFDLSLEGCDFWQNVCNHYTQLTPLPPLTCKKEQ